MWKYLKILKLLSVLELNPQSFGISDIGQLIMLFCCKKSKAQEINHKREQYFNQADQHNGRPHQRAGVALEAREYTLE